MITQTASLERQRLMAGTLAVAVGFRTGSRAKDDGTERRGFFWERLHQWGVRCVFGYPGDGINGLLGGLQRMEADKIRFVRVRHEEMAAFMASAYAYAGNSQ